MVLMSIMQIPTTRVDKATFKQIFRDYGEAFWQRYGHYFDANVRELVPGVGSSFVDKMLGCGDQASGYSTYRCEHCHEVKRVAFRIVRLLTVAMKSPAFPPTLRSDAAPESNATEISRSVLSR